MQTIKTAVVVVLLLAVCYGAIVALNAPDPKLPPELEQWAEQGELDLSMDPSAMVAVEMPKPAISQNSTFPIATPSSSSSSLGSLPGDSATLPKFDLSGAQVSANGLTSQRAGNSQSLIPEFQGPDGPMVSLPSSPPVSAPNISATVNAGPAASGGANSLPLNTGDVPTALAKQEGASPTGLLAGANSLPQVTAPALPSLPRAPASPVSSELSVPGYLTSASTSANSNTGFSASAPSNSPNQSTNSGSLANTLGATTPPSLGGASGTDRNAAASASTVNSQISGSPTAVVDETRKLPTQPFRNAREQALKQVKDGKLKDALFTLSMFYGSVELTRDEYYDMLEILDELAKEVIYSRRHLMELPYRAVPGDTVESISIKYGITRDLLIRVNGMDNSNVVLPGTELKVLRGPFRAQVDLTRGELTLFVGELYAGRFPISVGQDPVAREGSFEIVDKRIDRPYYGAGSDIPANDPRNPYGGYWINLGQDMCIHGTAEMATSELSKAGCISLAPIDAANVYAILAQGAKVRVHR